MLFIFVIAVFLLTISSMYLQACNQCQKKSDSITFSSSSYKFGVLLVVVSVLVIVGCIGKVAFGFTPAGRVAGRLGNFI